MIESSIPIYTNKKSLAGAGAPDSLVKSILFSISVPFWLDHALNQVIPLIYVLHRLYTPSQLILTIE